MLKWIGAVLVLCGCGGLGFTAARQLRREEMQLRQLSAALEYMSCELECRRSPLPQLLESVGQAENNAVGKVLDAAAQLMKEQQYPDVESCMAAAIGQYPPQPKTAQLLRRLGSSLGRFDLQGQQAALASAEGECNRILQEHCADLSQRVRNYRILGLCAGGALAILLL